MKTNIYKVLFLAMVVIAIILAVKVYFAPKPIINVAVKKSNPIIDKALIEAKKIADKVDKKGMRTAVFERTAEILGNGDISKIPISKEMFDSLMLDNVEKGAKLQQASAIIGKLEARNLKATLIIDSLNKKQYFYTDSFATARFTLDSVGTGFFDIDYRINLIRHDYKMRSWFLSPYTYRTDIISPDSRVKINGLKVLSFNSQKPTSWGIGLIGGYGYSFNERMFSPFIGAGLTYNLIRW